MKLKLLKFEQRNSSLVIVRFAFLCTFLTGSAAAMGQSMVINFTDGNNATTVLSDIRSVVFPSGTMTLNLTNGSVLAWDRTEINHFGYSDLLTETNNPITTENSNLAIYPNPTEGLVTIEFSLNSSGIAVIEIFDIHGSLVKKLTTSSTGLSSQRLTWNGMDDSGNLVSNGVYLCRITSKGETSTERMVINR